MKTFALKYLACPVCKGELLLENAVSSSESSAGAQLIGNAALDISEGQLRCRPCTTTFPVIRGVPRFVQAELSGVIDLKTGDRFADSWERFSRIHSQYSQQFFDWIAPVTADFLIDKVVLDAGCGKGRHTFVVANSGAQMVIAVDIGDAVEIALKNVGDLPNVIVIQADLKALPLKPVIDFAFSVGVLHHMQDPAAGFSSIRSVLKPTGAISVWVYGAENNGWIIKVVNPIRTAITSKMPAALLSPLSFMIAILVYLLSRAARVWLILQEHLSFLPNLFYQSYLSYIGQFDLIEIHNIVFDHLVAPIAYYLKKTEIENWYSTAGILAPQMRWHNQNSWSAFGSLPDTDQPKSTQ